MALPTATDSVPPPNVSPDGTTPAPTVAAPEAADPNANPMVALLGPESRALFEDDSGAVTAKSSLD
ncbi:MAG: hypothetical protein AB1705_25685, partial [Verrucomicrobiota bacterium]